MCAVQKVGFTDSFLGCTPAPIFTQTTEKTVYAAQKSWLRDQPADVSELLSDELIKILWSFPEMALFLT